MGRALYRESGPSQDGDPDTGNLLFCAWFFFFLTLFMFFFLNLPFYSQECPFLLVFSLQCIIGGLLPLTDKFILYLQCQIEDVHRNVAGFEHYYI